MTRLNYELFDIQNCLNLYGKGISCECDADNQLISCSNEVLLVRGNK
jgi:hypothetical protein